VGAIAPDPRDEDVTAFVTARERVAAHDPAGAAWPAPPFAAAAHERLARLRRRPASIDQRTARARFPSPVPASDRRHPPSLCTLSEQPPVLRLEAHVKARIAVHFVGRRHRGWLIKIRRPQDNIEKLPQQCRLRDPLAFGEHAGRGCRAGSQRCAACADDALDPSAGAHADRDGEQCGGREQEAAFHAARAPGVVALVLVTGGQAATELHGVLTAPCRLTAAATKQRREPDGGVRLASATRESAQGCGSGHIDANEMR
jgi:hypothetical protein